MPGRDALGTGESIGEAVSPITTLVRTGDRAMAENLDKEILKRDSESVSKKGTGTGQELVFSKVFTSIGRSQSPFLDTL